MFLLVEGYVGREAEDLFESGDSFLEGYGFDGGDRAFAVVPVDREFAGEADIELDLLDRSFDGVAEDSLG